MAPVFLKTGSGIARRRILKRSISDENSKPGGLAAALSYYFALTALTDNTVATFCTVMIPNAIVQAGMGLTILGGLGDGDSAEESYWTIAFSRVVGANAKIAISAKTSNIATAGATANAAVTLSNVAVSGAVGALNAFALQVKVARSAGASDLHSCLIDAQIYNLLSNGAYIS